MFKKGDKVVCIRSCCDCGTFVEGKTYEVSRVGFTNVSFKGTEFTWHIDAFKLVPTIERPKRNLPVWF